MPFFLTMLAFLALPFGSDFLAYFLLAAARVFMPCLSFGFMQPQVAHIISSSLHEGQQSQIPLACRSCLHQVSFALETSSLQSSCKRLYSPALNNRIHMTYTLFLTFRMRVLFMPLFGCLYAFFDGLGSSFLG